MGEDINDKKGIALEDLKSIINIEKLQEDKPKLVIVATRCDVCGKLHPFIFSGETLYYAMNYVSWHQYQECECGNEVAVYSGHGDFVYNPHEFVFKDEVEG